MAISRRRDGMSGWTIQLWLANSASHSSGCGVRQVSSAGQRLRKRECGSTDPSRQYIMVRVDDSGHEPASAVASVGHQLPHLSASTSWSIMADGAVP
jgi:hypothetical protein